MDWDIYKLGAELNSYNYQEVQDGIMAILEKGSNVVLDMTGCKYVSSMGLRVLLYSKKVAMSKELQVYLVGVNADVKDIMSVTGFDNFFDSFDTMEECMEKVKNL